MRQLHGHPKLRRLGKAILLLAIDKPDYFGDNMSDDISPQFSASTDSEPFDVNDELCDLAHVKGELVTGGDPSWVARPRNAFIIFRCEYARRHSKMRTGVKRGTGPTSEKSLSKRAAEAWHQLSSKEKNHFKTLADQERSEHARLHPDYRFRPVKRFPPPRITRPRAASSSNLLRKRSSDDGTVKPKSSGGLSSPSASMCSADVSKSCPQTTYDSLYPSHSISCQASSGSCYSVLNTHSCEETKVLVPNADINSYTPLGPLHSHLEDVLSPISQHDRNMELCPLQHPMPKCAATPSSVLIDWNGITTDSLMTASCPEERKSPTCLSEDPSENVCMDMQYSPYGDPYTLHPEYLCSDFMETCHPATVSSHSQTMFSSYFPVNY